MPPHHLWKPLVTYYTKCFELYLHTSQTCNTEAPTAPFIWPNKQNHWNLNNTCDFHVCQQYLCIFSFLYLIFIFCSLQCENLWNIKVTPYLLWRLHFGMQLKRNILILFKNLFVQCSTLLKLTWVHIYTAKRKTYLHIRKSVWKMLSFKTEIILFHSFKCIFWY